MKILGINGGWAAPVRIDGRAARPLSDGAAALLINGRIACATIEERHTRKRYAGGFSESATACLEYASISPHQVDAIGHSTCCDVRWTRESDILDDIVESWRKSYTPDYLASSLKGRLHSIDHHESHALLAFSGSGYRRALVCVMDGLGNRYDEPDTYHTGPDWWKGAFQRQDIYLAEWIGGRVRLEKIHEDAAGPDEIGVGEIYRSVTHYLGWSSYQYAGKTMALAAYGNPRSLSDAAFVTFREPDSVIVPAPNLHTDPTRQVVQVLTHAGHPEPLGLARPAGPHAQFLCDVAATLQDQVERALIKTVIALADRHGMEAICFGGGVAMNCVALGKLAVARPDYRLYVPPAPADTGQALGNALWLAYAERSPVSGVSAPFAIRHAGLGPRYSERRIASAIRTFQAEHRDLAVRSCRSESELAALVVARLVKKQVVGIRFGGAEYGPRALGFASMIADPREHAMHDVMVSLKRRERFRPYAPSILAEYVKDYFEITTPSPFMSFAGRVRREKQDRIPAVVHVDGTARYQTVARGRSAFRKILSEFERCTGIPALLNTSFNLDGEPIVESPEDTLSCFYRSRIHSLAIGKWIIDRM